MIASDIAYQVWGKLGKIETFEEFIATGGSTTTVINGKVAERQDRPEDNYSIDGTVVVVRDAGGASAAPEGEMQRISSYNSSTYTHEVDTAFTAAPASGDYIAIANSDIPLREMYRAINNALREMGEIPLTNSSLTSASNQTEYTLPVALKREDLLRIEYQTLTNDTDNNEWQHIQKYDIIPSAPGSTSILVLPQLPADRTIRITYMGVHPAITTYSSVISEYIHPAVVYPAVIKQILSWQNALTGGGENYWLQRENEASQELEDQLRKHPIWTPKQTPRYFSFKANKSYFEFPELPFS